MFTQATRRLLIAPRARRRLFSSQAEVAQRTRPSGPIAEYALKRQTGVNMQALLSTGMGLRLDKSSTENSLSTKERTLIQVASFLHHELPIRLAHRAIELEELPHGLSQMPSVRTVRDWYVESFNELLAHPKPRTVEEEASFEQVLRRIYDRHAPTLLKMARGVHEFKQTLRKETSKGSYIWEYPEVHQFLDSFYVSRIGIRILIGQYLELRQPQEVRGQPRAFGPRQQPDAGTVRRRSTTWGSSTPTRRHLSSRATPSKTRATCARGSMGMRRKWRSRAARI